MKISEIYNAANSSNEVDAGDLFHHIDYGIDVAPFLRDLCIDWNKNKRLKVYRPFQYGNKDERPPEGSLWCVFLDGKPFMSVVTQRLSWSRPSRCFFAVTDSKLYSEAMGYAVSIADPKEYTDLVSEIDEDVAMFDIADDF